MNFYYAIDEFFYFITDILNSIVVFILDNELIFRFILIPIVATCIIICFDLIMNIRDNSEFNQFKDNAYTMFRSIRYHRYLKNKKLYMEDVFNKSKANSDYKHRLKMEELNEFRANENLRHQHKIEENQNYQKSISYPKKTQKQVNLDIECED